MKNVIAILLTSLALTSIASAMECSPQALKEKALEKLSVPGTLIFLSNPTPIFEKSLDSKSATVGYSLRYLIQFGADYGSVGELKFLKLGDFCSPAALNTSETVTSVQVQ